MYDTELKPKSKFLTPWQKVYYAIFVHLDRTGADTVARIAPAVALSTAVWYHSSWQARKASITGGLVCHGPREDSFDEVRARLLHGTGSNVPRIPYTEAGATGNRQVREMNIGRQVGRNGAPDPDF